MRGLVVLVLALAVASADRIIGGSLTTINQYPYGAALILSASGSGAYSQACGATILNNRSLMTAAHCFDYHPLISQWRTRVGSSYANSGGSVFTTNRIIRHPNYNMRTFDNDIGVIRINGGFSFGNTIRAANIAGSNYNVADNQQVWAIGWGLTSVGGRPSEQLRHVQVWAINQNICRTRYVEVGRTITANMLCTGWLDVGGRDQCQGDSGGPVIHNNVVVGVCSFGERCALARYPGVNARVSRYTSWIQSNA